MQRPNFVAGRGKFISQTSYNRRAKQRLHQWTQNCLWEGAPLTLPVFAPSLFMQVIYHSPGVQLLSVWAGFRLGMQVKDSVTLITQSILLPPQAPGWKVQTSQEPRQICAQIHGSKGHLSSHPMGPAPANSHRNEPSLRQVMLLYIAFPGPLGKHQTGPQSELKLRGRQFNTDYELLIDNLSLNTSIQAWAWAGLYFKSEFLAS